MIANPSISQQLEIGAGVAKRSMSLLGAGAVTVGLLFMMTQLISNEMPVLEEERSVLIPEFIFFETETPPVIIDIVKPVVEEQPPTEKIDYTETFEDNPNAIEVPITKYDGPPKIEIDSVGGGLALVPISPQFPEIAARKGLCGHVMVQFDINAEGIPVNVAILESSSRVFNKSAVQAVERARYKPNSQGGQPTATYGKVEKISYKLEEGC